MTAARSSRLFVQRRRTGICICGRATAAHYGTRNQFISCDELVDRDAAIAAAASCTTAATAMSAIAHAQLHRATVSR